jgi:phage shock protein C
MLGGVCGGIGGYLQVNPTWIRIIWVVLTLFTWIIPMILLYIILWALLPEENDPMVIEADYHIRE